MENTHFHDDLSVVVKEWAVGYCKNGGGWRIDDSTMMKQGTMALACRWTVIVLCNLRQMKAGRLAERVAEIRLGDHMT